MQYPGHAILSAYLPPPDHGLTVIHADTEIIVVDKPAGLLSVPGRGAGMDDCLASRVQARFPDALIAHRLDMSTSGLLILARGAEMHRQLSRFFRDRQIGKRYVAIVDGLMEDDTGEVDLPLICDWPNRPRQKVDFEMGKASQTRYRVISRDFLADHWSLTSASRPYGVAWPPDSGRRSLRRCRHRTGRTTATACDGFKPFSPVDRSNHEISQRRTVLSLRKRPITL